MSPEKKLIKKCLEGDAEAQKKLYDQYAPALWPVCLRYAKNRMAAEDVMQEGFIKIFKYLGNYKGEGSFEGWMRRTMVNTAINIYKKNLKMQNDKNIDFVYDLKNDSVSAISQMNAEDILKVVQTLPDGYRTIFNLFVVEGYPHKDIAAMLGISENTSKSQLSRARSILQVKIKKLFDLDK